MEKIAILGWIFGLLLVMGVEMSRIQSQYALTYERAVQVRPRIEPTSTPMPTPTVAVKSVLLSVPFASQSPYGEWSDPRQQDGCEEASSLMAVEWARGNESKVMNKDVAKGEILAIWDYQVERWGGGVDTGAEDTMKRIINGYFGYTKAEVRSEVTVKRMAEELARGRLIIVPTDGRLLNNPNFTGLGPERHMLVIRGYDLESREFITNDPGTRQGELYRYPEEVMLAAIRDYPTGTHVPIGRKEKKMIVVEKE